MFYGCLLLQIVRLLDLKLEHMFDHFFLVLIVKQS